MGIAIAQCRGRINNEPSAVKRIIAFSLSLIGIVGCGPIKNKFAVENVPTISAQV